MITKEEIKESELFKRCKKVVESCTTMDQIYVARKYSSLAVKKYLKNNVNLLDFETVYDCFVTHLFVKN